MANKPPAAAGKQRSATKSELLAPAGSLEAFFAALENGADAVYCGLAEFSARAKAKNFTPADLARMTAFAHRQGRKLYVTLNTLLKEKELPRLGELLAELETMAVDGIIIQDLGVWRLARRHFPGLPLHASTQMTIHNAAGVRILEELGFSRAVLARELTLTEIADIRRQSTIELEHFVHGALCFAFSGQCFFSSALSGASGNRGRCAQPCRRRYQLGDRSGYFFSTSDLCALELLPRLQEAGVVSFKIEGRMKSADYVARVVAAYRLMLDAPAGQRKEALRRAGEQLELAFGRESTKGFLGGGIPGGLSASRRQGTLGRQLGEVSSLRGGLLGFTTSERLHVGDRIRVQPANDQAGSGFTVREILRRGRKVKAVAAGDFLQIPIPAQAGFFQPGDTIFKVGGKAAFLLSPQACRAKLEGVKLPPATTVTGKSAPLPWEQESGPAGNEQEPPQPLNGEYMLRERGVEQEFSLTVRGRDLHDLALLADPAIGRLELPLTPENLAGLPKAEKQAGLQWQRLSWEIPPLLFGGQWQEYRRAVQILAGRGQRTFRLNNPGHLPLFAGLDNPQLLGGFRCYAMNSQAIRAWGELGLSELVLNLEDDRENIETLLTRFATWPRPLPTHLVVTVYAPLPILLSRIPIKGLRPGTVLYSDREQGFRVLQHQGLTEVIGERDFSLSGQLARLQAQGARHLLADLSHCGATSAKGRQVLAALAADQPLPNTVSFNYRRGLA